MKYVATPNEVDEFETEDVQVDLENGRLRVCATTWLDREEAMALVRDLAGAIVAMEEP